MPRPILTDDIIEKARQDKKKLDYKLQKELENDQEIAEKYDNIERELSKNLVYKSRRIENAKAKKRSKTVNKWLWIVVLIVLVFGVSFFLYYF